MPGTIRRLQLLGAIVLMSAGACTGGDGAGDAGSGDTSDAATDIDSGIAEDASPACASATAALGSELGTPGESCTAIVRLDYQTMAVKGYQVVCGAYKATDDGQAAATATGDTGYGTGDTMLNESNSENTYVFYDSPGDFGGASAVSSRNGLTVFGASIIWSGAGDINYPETWRDAGGLASGCLPSGGISSRDGWDLRGGSALPESDVNAAIGTVLATAVPGAYWSVGYVFHGTVLLYPRSVGVFQPETAEWVVLVHGGWLE